LKKKYICFFFHDYVLGFIPLRGYISKLLRMRENFL